jgi:hypothetical protein
VGALTVVSAVGYAIAIIRAHQNEIDELRTAVAALRAR